MRTSAALLPTLAVAALASLAGCMTIPGTGAGTRSASDAAVAPESAPAAASVAETEPPPPEATSIAPVVQWQDIAVPSVTSPPADLWAIMRRGFSLPDGDEARVGAQLAWYEEHPGYMRRTAERAKPYLYYVVQQLKKRGMPTDLALLPIVESAYDPYAYSSGRAAGLWQFIASTGRVYGLKENSWYDGRLDVSASTNAALSFLQALHGEFNDSWLLALAAYNSGAITVQRAIEHNRRRGLPTDFWHLDLPRQTRSYVPRLLAVRDIVASPQRYGIDLPYIADAPYLARIDLKGQLDLAVAANLAGIELKQLYLLNPGYTRWATPPDGPSALFVPGDKKKQVVTALDSMKLEKIPAWIALTIRPGETLSGIAERFGTSVANLQAHNDLRGSMIRAGHTLMVPTADQSFLRYAANRPIGVAENDPPPLGLPPGHSERLQIRVRRGDTLWGLAHAYRTSVAALARWNHIGDRDRLHIGEELVVWVTPESTPAIAAVERQKIPDAIRRIHYVVKDGDSLWAISNRFNVSLHKLARWNELSLSSVLHPGQHLTLFVDARDN